MDRATEVAALKGSMVNREACEPPRAWRIMKIDALPGLLMYFDPATENPFVAKVTEREKELRREKEFFAPTNVGARQIEMFYDVAEFYTEK